MRIIEREPKESVVVVDRGTSTFVYCQTCDRLLYETNFCNDITSHIAQNTLTDHVDAFTEPHAVIIYEAPNDGTH